MGLRGVHGYGGAGGRRIFGGSLDTVSQIRAAQHGHARDHGRVVRPEGSLAAGVRRASRMARLDSTVHAHVLHLPFIGALQVDLDEPLSWRIGSPRRGARRRCRGEAAS